jgi:hypothetical protein
MKRPILAALLLTAAPAAPALAQRGTVTELDSLARVRVTQSVDPGRVLGGLLAAGSSGLVIDPVHGGDRLAVPLAHVERLEVSLGQRTVREGALRGARKGAIVGVVTSALLIGMGAIQDAGDDCGECWITATGVAVLVSVPLIGITTGGGALLGAMSPGEKWQRVAVPPRVRQ